MSEPSSERVTAIADKGAEPTSAEVNHVLREFVQGEIDRLDRAEKAPNDALTQYGRFTRACLKRWLSWLDLPDTRDQLGNVARIVAAMEHDLLRNPSRGDVAAIMPMRDALTLYRVACGWIGHEPRVTKLEIEEKSERVAFCGQHFGSVDHPNRYVCELLSGHEGLHAAPSVNLRQHAEPVRMEMLGGGLMAEIGPLVIGEEIAQQLNAGIEPATGKGAVNFELKKVIRIDDLPEPSREECEATDSKGERLCHHAASVQLCHYHGRLWEVVEDASSQLARIAEYIASQPVSRFPGAAGRDVADVVIDALRASGEQRGGVLLEAKPAQDPETTRVVVAAAMLNHLMSRMHHPDNVTYDTRNKQVDEALAWADALIERSRRGKR